MMKSDISYEFLAEFGVMYITTQNVQIKLTAFPESVPGTLSQKKVNCYHFFYENDR